jgi:hypothetical protein
LSPTNSENEGTLFNLSLKYVGRRLVAGSEVEVSVAKVLEDAEMKKREACRRGGAFKHRNLEAAAAIVYDVEAQ